VIVRVVPGASAPGNEIDPLIDIVKSPADAVPPLSFTTCLITVSVAVGITASKHSPFVFGPPIVWFVCTPGEYGAKASGAYSARKQ